jgi:peptide/nickel transport system permease protein
MRTYIVRRLLLMIPMLFGVSIIIYVAIRSVPGSPIAASLGTRADPEAVAYLEEAYGLDKSYLEGYISWLGKIFEGDFGESFRRNEPVAEAFIDHLPVTIELVVLAMLLTIVIGVPSGIISAVRRNTPLDYGTRFMNVIWLSIPDFWLATLLLLLPAIWWGYAPPTGFVNFWDDPWKNLQQVYLAVIALGMGPAAITMRMTRSAMLEVFGSDYVRTARAKGLRERVVVGRHVLRNSLIPVITLLGLIFSFLLGGQVVIESIFTLPGLGRLLVESVFYRDYAVVQLVVLFMAAMILVLYLLLDIAYALLDRRIRYR